MTEYRALNRGHWDERAPAHAASPDYAVQRLVEDQTFISGVVRFDLPRLGNVSGARGVHLQCHIGTDTLSLARLGARMSGLDFSPASLAEARRLAAATGTQIEYVQAEVYDAVAAFGEERFDLVYTGVGALCWLPDVDRWAAVVAQLLAPGGRLFVREGHPMLWALDDAREDGVLALEYPYFELEEAIEFTEDGSYVQTDAAFEKNTVRVWNHGLGQIASAVLARGMRLTGLVEHDSVPWDALPGHMERVADTEYRLASRPWRLAHSYTLQAVKDG
jgi:SAM-dependent methyltransferase